MNGSTLAQSGVQHAANTVWRRAGAATALVFLSSGITGCLTSGSSSLTTTASSGGSSSFAGATSAQNLASDGTDIQISWSAASTPYTHYTIFTINSIGTLTPLQTNIPLSTTTYTQTGLTSGTLYSYVVQAVTSAGVSDGNMNTVSALAYAGVNQTNGASSIGLNTAYINFPAPGSSSLGAHIYCSVNGGAMPSTPTATVTSPSATSYELMGLDSGQNYVCQVNAISSANSEDDSNTATTSFQTISQGFTQSSPAYEGAILVQAYGDAPNAPTSTTAPAATPVGAPTVGVQSPVSTPNTRQVSITWKNFNVTNASTAEYRLVRVVQGGTFEMNTTTPCSSTTSTSCYINCGGTGGLSTTQSSSGSRTCTDTNIADSPTRYQYAVGLIVDTTTTPPLAEELPTSSSLAAPFEILVPIPPANMVLVQRDSANYKMCNSMGLTPDPLNHQRCAYTGLGATPKCSYAENTCTALNLTTTYYDFGYDLFVDRFGAGCNWTPSVSGGMCGAGETSGDCDGATNGAPASTIGVNGNVFYDLQGSQCYVKQGGTWYAVNSGSLTQASLIASFTNAPQLVTPSSARSASNTPNTPPMVDINQTNAWSECQAQVDTNYGPKRLLRRREQVVAAAFQDAPGDPGELASSAIGSLQDGTLHYATQACNANTHSGITNSVTTTIDTTSEVAGNSSGPASFVLGSDYTSQCVSRFGAQDMVGNVWYWTSDQLSSCSTTTHECIAGTSGLDLGNQDFTFNMTYNLDGTTGPGGTAAGQNSSDGSSGGYTTEWNFVSPPGPPTYTSSWAAYFSAPMGLPMVSNGGEDAGALTAANLSSLLHTDHFWLYSDDGNATRGAFVGGSWGSGSEDGRFALYLTYAPSGADYSVGFRCALPAE